MKKAFFILLAAIIVFTGCTKTEDETVPESVRASIRGNYYVIQESLMLRQE